MPKSSRDPSSLIAFTAFWLVVIVGCFLGFRVVHAMGMGGQSGHSPLTTLTRPHRGAVVKRGTAVSIASIFATRAPSLAGYDPRFLRTLIATGDVIPGRSVNYKMVTYHDFLYPFRPTARYLRSGDVTLVNLESPLVQGCPVTDSGMQFCGDPRAVQGLTFAGVDVACTANNHIGNYGPQGVQETWQHLSAAGIQHCGLGDVAYRTVRGLRFAFLAYNCVGQRFDYAAAREEIKQARRHAQVVVVSVHWGREYVSVPSTAPGIADDNPVRVAHWIVDSGADLIIGNHPHHVQGVEIYRGRLITYAHGNFIFDQMFSASTEEGVIGDYTFFKTHLVRVRFHAVHIYDYSQPRWASAAESHIVLQTMYDSSRELARTHRA